MLKRFKLVFVLLISNVYISNEVFASNSDVASIFEESKIVPDVVPKAPDAEANVTYSTGVEMQLGNKLAASQVKNQPDVRWDAVSDQMYTVALVDPDIPTPKAHIFRSFRHWLVINVLGDDMESGDVISSYFSPAPPPFFGLHRYVLLVYQQPEKLDPTELHNRTIFSRIRFSIAQFAKKHNLGDPVAGNFFRTEQKLSDIIRKK